MTDKWFCAIKKERKIKYYFTQRKRGKVEEKKVEKDGWIYIGKSLKETERVEECAKYRYNTHSILKAGTLEKSHILPIEKIDPPFKNKLYGKLFRGGVKF